MPPRPYPGLKPADLDAAANACEAQGATIRNFLALDASTQETIAAGMYQVTAENAGEWDELATRLRDEAAWARGMPRFAAQAHGQEEA